MFQTVGSVCSGIEAATVAWEPLGVRFDWFSEIAAFPSRLLAEKYPSTPNLGDMNNIPTLLLQEKINAPDLICGGTPCQGFSLAGWQNGLNDDRGNLTLRFVDLIDANDTVRLNSGLTRCKMFWENVEGVLTDKTNAFGCFLSALAGLPDVLKAAGGRWPAAGVIHGITRNIAWRVLDAKYFGLPQQRRRLYVIAGGTDFFPENVLFEYHDKDFPDYPSASLEFEKEGHHFEVFREYTDCLYSAYGTKWNGNAAAYNGSLFVVQDGRIRRLSPLEAERLMGFPDRYTDLKGAKKTNRYQGIGNSWAIPVVRWVGMRLMKEKRTESIIPANSFMLLSRQTPLPSKGMFLNFGKNELISLENDIILNCTSIPEDCTFSTLEDIVSPDAPEDIYLSPVGCHGIVRRKNERKLKINPRLEEVLLSISSQMPFNEIEKRSRIQHRGRFSENSENG